MSASGKQGRSSSSEPRQSSSGDRRGSSGGVSTSSEVARNLGLYGPGDPHIGMSSSAAPGGSFTRQQAAFTTAQRSSTGGSIRTQGSGTSAPPSYQQATGPPPTYPGGSAIHPSDQKPSAGPPSRHPSDQTPPRPLVRAQALSQHVKNSEGQQPAQMTGSIAQRLRRKSESVGNALVSRLSKGQDQGEKHR